MAEFAPVFVTVVLGAAVEVTSRVLWAGAKKCTKVAKKGTKFAKQLTYSARENSRKRLTAAGSNRRSREMARISGASDMQQHEVRQFERRGGGSIQPYRSSHATGQRLAMSGARNNTNHYGGLTTTEHEERVKIRRNGTKVVTRTNRVIRGDTTTEYEESAEVRRNGTKVYKRTNREITGRR